MSAALFEAQYLQPGEKIDYTPSEAVAAGQVVIVGAMVCVAIDAIAANTLGALYTCRAYKMRREEATAFTRGQKIFWDEDATPEGGSSGTGAAVATAKGGVNKYAGICLTTVADGDDNLTVDVLLIPPSLQSAVDLPDVADAEIGIPILFEKTISGAAAETKIFDANCPRKLRVIDVSFLVTTSGAAAADVTGTLDNGTNDITDAMAVNDDPQTITAKDIVRAAEVDNTYSTIAKDGTLEFTLSTTTNAPAGIVRVLAVPVA